MLRELLANGYVVIDTESTGLDPAVDRIIEIGAWRMGEVPAPPEAVLVNPGVPLPPIITEITGITPLDLEGCGISTQQALAWLHRRLGDLPVVGHNLVRFDLPLIEAEARRSGVPYGPIGERVIIDTAALYKGWRLGDLPSAGSHMRAYAEWILDRRVYGLKYNLAYACDFAGVSTQGVMAHRAAGDVQLTQRLLVALLDAIEPTDHSGRDI